ncbi:MAG: DUF2341 domain-containing protein [Thermoplasmata archaeon]|nr:DUF2341 domain-containing protein [Thermoplasmata archaeon]
MKGIVIKTGLVFGLVMVLLSTNIAPGLLGRSSDSIQQKSVDALFIPTPEKTSVFSLNVFGTTGLKKQDVALSADDATLIFDKLKELKSEMTQHPYSEKTQSLKIAFVDLLDEKGLIPQGVSKEAYLSLLNPRWVERLQKTGNTASFPQPFANRGTCVLCSLGGEGSGILLPLFLLPRPRIAMLWLGTGLTTAANLLTSKGYIAEGAQTGFAFGFMGIGISYALPGYTLYGFIGYALLTSTTAEYVEHYPPNRAPTISDVLPADGEQNIPLSLSELQFRIQDADGDLMSYTVTTEPDIGSASGNLKPFGVYTVPVSGLVDLTKYTWHIQVTDGKDTTEETMTFTTEAIAPIISNPLPADGERDVPMDIPQLQFTLKDYQGDTMEYTIQTSPNIGSDHKVGVHDGTYTVPVSGLTYGATYLWYVNVTDGTHWTRKIFSFETGYPSQFNPFEFGWQYQKQITIDHTQVAETLTNFPVVVSTTDVDLTKAQDDGGDILFMNGAGVTKRQYHEIETFNQTSGGLTAWVNITTLSSTQDTIMYMYYGNPSCINQEYPERTWNTYFKAVWHLKENPIGSILDSTSNNNNGIAYGSMGSSSLITGKVGSCLKFDGNDDYVSIPDSSSLKPLDVTLVAWYQPQQQDPPEGTIVAKHCYDYWDNAAGQTYGFYLDPNHAIRGVFEKNAYEQVDAMGTYPITTDTWYYLTLTFEESTGTGNFYVNGVLEGTKNCDSSVLWYNDPWDFVMGGCRWGTGGSQSVNTFFACALDEIRVLNTPLSSGWIATEYNNQNNPLAFLGFGPEVPGP